jgi:hypothetical protein
MNPLLPLAFALLASTARAETPGHGHAHAPAAPHDHAALRAAAPDLREQVAFPPDLKEATLANMREHLQTIQAITSYLADRQFDAAADLAETRLGMTSLQRHDAHTVAQYMPEDMRQIGHGMHQAASRFAIIAKDAGVSGDTGAALRALADVQSSCLACHAGYRLR